MPLPESMALATTDLSGHPSVRMVMLHVATSQGFTFYTDYESRKGHELAKNPRASLLFFWSSLGCQVRIEGDVSKLPGQESDKYFEGRPRESQLAAMSFYRSGESTTGNSPVISLAPKDGEDIDCIINWWSSGKVTSIVSMTASYTRVKMRTVGRSHGYLRRN